MTILITGANRGIGAALLDHYAASGMAVFGTARQPKGGLLGLDVTDAQSVAGLAAKVAMPLDVLICNAGIYPASGDTLDNGFAPADWAAGFATNVTGVFLTIQALLPQLRAAKGKIAIIASVMGSDARAPGGSYIYRASKAAVLNLGRNLAMDLRRDGVAVGIYHPGWVQTDMGGDSADITVTQSAQGLAAQFAALSIANTGCFEDYTGATLPF